MRSAPTALKNWLDSLTGRASCWRCDLITLTVLDPVTSYYWTTAEFDIPYNTHTYRANGGTYAPGITRSKYTMAKGLAVDTLDLTLISAANSAFLIGGKSMGLLAAQGYFDGGRVSIAHAISPTPGDITTYGVIDPWFEGPVASVDPEPMAVKIRLKSQLEKANVPLPRNVLMPACNNSVYDAGCTLNKTTWSDTGAAFGTPTTITVISADATIMAKATGYYSHGVMTFTSGANNGVRRVVSTSSRASSSPHYCTFTFVEPWPTAPAAADTFTVYPGCSRTAYTCKHQFDNLANFRGFPYLPAPEGS
jgi:hypothetical protein